MRYIYHTSLKTLSITQSEAVITRVTLIVSLRVTLIAIANNSTTLLANIIGIKQHSAYTNSTAGYYIAAITNFSGTNVGEKVLLAITPFVI